MSSRHWASHDFHFEASRARDQITLPGQLQGFMKMPVDIFDEVCVYVAPLDLRHLSLASRRLRNILMSSNARHIWKSSRQNTFSDMPDCPKNLSEPQYVFFMFVDSCHACSGVGQCVDFSHCLRFCDACERASFMSLYTIEIRYAGFPTGLLPDVALEKERNIYHGFGSEIRKYKTNEVAELYQQFTGLPPDIDSEGHSQRTEFVREFRIMHLAREQAGRARQSWLRSEILSQQQAREKFHKQRVSFALEKCKELGYKERDFFGKAQNLNRWYAPMADITPLNMEGIMNMRSKMTEMVWETVRWKVEAVVKVHKAMREAEEAEARLATRKKSLINRFCEVRRAVLPIAGFHYPRDDQLLQFDPIKAIFEADTPDITNEIWATVADAAAQFVEREHLSLLKDLCGRLGILEDTDDRASMAKTLSLATSAFKCSHCDTAMWFPDLVAHSDRSEPGCLLSKMAAAPPGLVAAILRTLELPEDSTYETLRSKDGDYIICARCDIKITSYYTITELIIHYYGAHFWFTKAASIGRSTAYPNLDLAKPVPTLFDDHDWMRDLPLCKHYRGIVKGSLLKLQSRFQRQILADRADDMYKLEDKKLALQVRKAGLSVRRVCLLCPTGLSPLPTSAAELKLHIETRHAKVPDLAHDAAIFLPGDILPHTPCPQKLGNGLKTSRAIQ